MTLGNGVDELSELYLNHEQLEEAYITDCLSLMLLSNAYEQFAKAVEEESSLYAIELSFLGDEYPLELLPEIFEHVSLIAYISPVQICSCHLRQPPS